MKNKIQEFLDLAQTDFIRAKGLRAYYASLAKAHEATDQQIAKAYDIPTEQVETIISNHGLMIYMAGFRSGTNIAQRDTEIR